MQVVAFPHFRFDILQCAHQHLKRHTDDLVTIALSKIVQAKRSLFQQCGTIDKVVYHKAMGKHSKSEQMALLRLQCQAYWTDAQQGALYECELEGRCFHCGAQAGDLMHLWKCPGLQEERAKADPELAGIDPGIVPPHILLGVPDARPAQPQPYLVRPPRQNEIGHMPGEQLLVHQENCDIELQ
jgi:hypothetical protein